MKYVLYEVGGKVRDNLLGLKSKDIDYSVVIQNPQDYDTPEDAFWAFNAQLLSEGFAVYLPTEECFTVRAKFPENHQYSGDADFVLARKETGYKPGTRTPIVELGTLDDDLLRRDFTVNALALDSDGDIIDLFGGLSDLNLKSLDTPGDPNLSFNEDPLRILRGMRFCITKGFTFSRDVRNAITEVGIHGIEVVSEERIRDEMFKCFKHDTKKTLEYLNYMEDVLHFPIRSYIFDNTNLWLEPTNKK